MTLIGFSLANAITAKILAAYDLTDKLGTAIFMPDIFSWQITIPIFIFFFLLWVFLAIWNEETEKFVIF